ncbi:MAG: S49 family peptidase, partial [Parvibaculaceae bacterium]
NPRILLSAKPSRVPRSERLGVSDGVGVVYITGVLVKRASWISELLGWTSYEQVRRDLQVAMDDKAITSIALYVDSPGGEANGCDELAAAIYGARGKKPITAFVSGMACSGGYWLASAAERVVVSDAAMLGSIGVAMGVEDRSRRDEQQGIERFQFVSSQSPNKSMAPARIQKMVDEMAAVFIAAVAKHRNVSSQIVIQKFGAGGVEIGAKAVALGMADSVGSWESVVAKLKNGAVPIRSTSLSVAAPAKAPVVAVPVPPIPAQQTRFEAARQAAQTKARLEVQERIRTIFESVEAKTNRSRAEFYAFSTNKSAQDAIAALRQDNIDASWRKAVDRVNARLNEEIT